MTTAAAVRVADGAAFLDAEHPDWWRTINLDRLRMESECRCILGQIWGSYYQAPIAPDVSVRLGFDAADDTHDDTGQLAEFDALTEAWRCLIERRRAEAGAA